jgi:hypothetical protein
MIPNPLPGQHIGAAPILPIAAIGWASAEPTRSVKAYEADASTTEVPL